MFSEQILLEKISINIDRIYSVTYHQSKNSINSIKNSNDAVFTALRTSVQSKICAKSCLDIWYLFFFTQKYTSNWLLDEWCEQS